LWSAAASAAFGFFDPGTTDAGYNGGRSSF